MWPRAAHGRQVVEFMKSIRTLLITVAVLAGAGAAAPAAFGYIQITSPTGNIDCIIASSYGGSASCLVQKTSWARYPARPKSCDLDWARSQVTLQKRKVVLGGCRGDIGPQCIAGSAVKCRTLAYGKSATLGTIRCTSLTTGMMCRRTTGATKPGFKVSKQGYTLYR